MKPLFPSAIIALAIFACNQAEGPKTEVAAAESFNLAAAKDSIIATNNRFAAAKMFLVRKELLQLLTIKEQ